MTVLALGSTKARLTLWIYFAKVLPNFWPDLSGYTYASVLCDRRALYTDHVFYKMSIRYYQDLGSLSSQELTRAVEALRYEVFPSPSMS
jgi:hypothetical protein